MKNKVLRLISSIVFLLIIIIGSLNISITPAEAVTITQGAPCIAQCASCPPGVFTGKWRIKNAKTICEYIRVKPPHAYTNDTFDVVPIPTKNLISSAPCVNRFWNPVSRTNANYTDKNGLFNIVLGNNNGPHMCVGN